MDFNNIFDKILSFFSALGSQFAAYFSSLDAANILSILQYNPRNPLLFSSGAFLFIFLAFMLGYWGFRKQLSARLLFVTLFSYYFFYKSSGVYFLLLVIITISDFYIARRIAQSEKKKTWLALSLFIDLGMLAYFKYTNFFAGMVSQMIGNNFQPWDIFLPVGISFYTFKTISYTVDVYRDKMKPLESLLDYAFYVSFFPTLLAGPITRANDFVPQIRKPLHLSNEMFAQGVFLIVIGLLKRQ